MTQTFKNRILLTAVLFITLLAPWFSTAAHAASYALDLTAADPSIYYGEGSNTTLTATLQADGTPLGGAPVSFTIVRGGGTLSAAQATTDEAGRAQVTYTAPASLELGRVVVIQASYTTPEATTLSAPTTIFLGSAAEFTALETIQTLPGRQQLSPAGMPITVTKRGAGTPIISLGSFDTDPYRTVCKAEPGPPELGPALSCTRGPAPRFIPVTPFLLVHLSSVENVDGLLIRISYRRERNEQSLRLFWHSAAGWRPVQGARLNTAANEVTFLVTATSTPSLRQLRSGQVGFVVAH